MQLVSNHETQGHLLPPGSERCLERAGSALDAPAPSSGPAQGRRRGDGEGWARYSPGDGWDMDSPPLTAHAAYAGTSTGLVKLP